MESNEFREKLHAYTNCMDPSTFINAFTDAYYQYKEDLDQILQAMEKAKIEYQNTFKA